MKPRWHISNSIAINIMRLRAAEAAESRAMLAVT